MKRRVLIAQALVHKPPVIVLDEPTAGVDLELRHKLWEFVGDLHRQGHTVILTTHYLQEAQNLCSRIAIINHGEVVAVGATQSLLSACRQTAVTFRLEQGDLPVALSDKLLRREGSLMTLAYTSSADLAFILSTLQAGGLAAEGITTRLTLLKKEVIRFKKVAFHTVAAPVISSFLYLVVFSAAIGERAVGDGYQQFLVPGLVMMAVLQNAFANTFSSFVQSKISGTLVFILMPPMNGYMIAAAYILASILRGLLVGVCVLAATMLFTTVSLVYPGWILVFAVLGALIMAALGLIAAIWAQRYEEMGVIQNFLIMPLTFLGGVFYSTSSLPGMWQDIARMNPLFYLIDGFRGGFIGRFESDPFLSLIMALPIGIVLTVVCALLIQKGYRIRS